MPSKVKSQAMAKLARQSQTGLIQSVKLGDVLKAVPKPKYILGTTYTLSLAFFESIVFPCLERTSLKSCLIIADSFGYGRALEEAPALQGAGQDYMVAACSTAWLFPRESLDRRWRYEDCNSRRKRQSHAGRLYDERRIFRRGAHSARLARPCHLFRKHPLFRRKPSKDVAGPEERGSLD